MVTYVYFVRFRIVTSNLGTLDKPVEGSLILERAKFISANEDLEDIEYYIERYVEGNVVKVEILALSLLHGLSDTDSRRSK